MKVVYEAEHLVDAHLIAGLLRAEGIDSFIKGEYLLGAIGELPVANLVAVCVSEEAWPRARAMVEEHERWREEEAREAAERGEEPEADPA